MTILDEFVSAMRGCVALVMGRRDAPSYFDFSQKGLVGSLIAVVLAIAVAGYWPLLTGVQLPPGSATQSILMNCMLFVAQAGTAFLALRQMGRQDGFIPYMVASNWVTLLVALISPFTFLLGPAGIIVVLLVAVVALTTFINVGRLIVTLKPLQIGLLFLSQAVGVFLAIIVLGLMLGPVLPSS